MSGAPVAADGLTRLTQHLGGDSDDCRQDLQDLFTSAAAFPQGQAALPVLEMLGAAYQAARVVQPEGPAAGWADFLRQRLAYASDLPPGLGLARSLRPAPPAWISFNQLVALADLHAGHMLSPSVQAMLGVLVAQAIRPMDGSAPRAIEVRTLARLVSMARACGGLRNDKAVAEWQKMERLSPMTADALRKFAGTVANSEVRRLAHAVAAALENPDCGLPPRSCFMGPPRPAKQPAQQAPAGQSGQATRTNAKSTRRVRPPSAASLVSLAYHARASMTTSVSEAWGTVPLAGLTSCTAGLMNALCSGEPEKVDFAIGLLVSFLTSHHLASALRLSLRDNDDFFYAPTSGCVWLSRRALLKLADADDGSGGWFYFLLPEKLVDVINGRLQDRPEAVELADLLSRPADKAWIQEARRYLMSFGDSAYPLYLGRWARSYGPAVAAAGAGDAMAGHLSGRLVLAPDAGSHYYGVPTDTVRLHVRLAFAALGLGEPVATPRGAVFGRRLWSDDELRQEHTEASRTVLEALTLLGKAADLNAAAVGINAGMVAVWRGYIATTPSRSQLPGRVTLDSALSHPDWHYRWDEDGSHRSDRLLPIGSALRSIFAATVALREAYLDRLRALGVEGSDLPMLLAAPKGKAPLFLQAFPHPRQPGRWAVAALGSREHGGPPQGYKAGDTDGRAFWLSEGLTSMVHGAERVLGGHGRRAAHPGHPAQTIPVLTRLEEVRDVVHAAERRLRLPPFAGQSASRLTARPFSLDLSFVDRRKPVGSRPSDLLGHYCDPYTLPALQCIEVCEDALGQGPRMDGDARVLLALIVAQGAVDSSDVELLWAVLQSMYAGTLARELVWTRTSGQEMSLPLLHPLWVALVLLKQAGVASLPPLREAEASLRGWLLETFPASTWPAKNGAVIAALGFLAARVVRLVVPPFAVKAYAPALMAATFDRLSHDRLWGRPQRPLPWPAPSGYRRPRPRSRDGAIAELRGTLWRFTDRTRPLGGDEKRALRVGRVLWLKFGPSRFSGCEWLGWVWLTLEASRWAPLHARRNAPITWYQYFCYLAGRLSAAPREWQPDQFDEEGWRRFGAFVLDVSAYKSTEVQARILTGLRKALTRFVLLLSERPEYRLAMHALEGVTNQQPVERYAPSAASAMVLPSDIAACVANVHQASELGRFEAQKRALLFMLPMDLCGRTAEPLCVRPRDFSSDRSTAVVRESPLSHLKNTHGRRYNALAPATQEAAAYVLASLQQLPVVQRYVFIQSGSKVDLRIGESLQDELWPQLAAQTGNIRVRWYSLRGAGLMQHVGNGWEIQVMSWLRGPFLARHARRLLDALAERGPGHFQWAICRTAHLSEGTPTAVYLPFWTYIYAAGLCLRMQRVKVSPQLANALPDRNSGSLRKWNWDCRHTYRMPVDEWAWTIQASVPGWTMKDERQAAEPPREPRPPKTPSAEGPLHRLTALRHVLLRLLGHDPELDGVRVARQHQSTCDEIYDAAPRFDEVHTARERVSGVAVPRGSALKLVQSPEGLLLLRSLARAEAHCVHALQRVLTLEQVRVPERIGLALSPERLELALRALPSRLGLELAPAAGALSTAQTEALKRVARFHLRETLKRSRDASTTRVVPWPHARPKDFHRPAMWSALIRMAVHILGLIETQLGK